MTSLKIILATVAFAVISMLVVVMTPVLAGGVANKGQNVVVVNAHYQSPPTGEKGVKNHPDTNEKESSRPSFSWVSPAAAKMRRMSKSLKTVWGVTAQVQKQLHQLGIVIRFIDHVNLHTKKMQRMVQSDKIGLKMMKARLMCQLLHLQLLQREIQQQYTTSLLKAATP